MSQQKVFMLQPIWMDYLIELLSEESDQAASPIAEFSPLPNAWRALSLLQKTIRRGDELQALRAA